ncbi:MAG: hypothetical protein OEV08_15410 [Nitrospira sp.]|nr:hypothetical protein [Nitrospira sp.]
MGYLTQLREKTRAERTVAAQAPNASPAMLSLKATLLDANNNLVLEGGEPISVRIDVTNSGTLPSGQTSLSLSGTPVLIDAFAGALSSPVQIAALQPGETKSTILSGTMPPQTAATRGELTVTATPNGAGGTAVSQTLVAGLAPTVTTAASVPSFTPQAPSAATGSGHDPDRYAIVIGLDLYRSPWPGWREGLSFDRKDTLALLAGSLDVPAGHTLLLQNEMATQADLEEALALWLPKRVTGKSVVFFYFAGHTLADPTNGEVFLLPYDATPASSPSRLIALRFLQARLQKLGARLAVSILDAPLAQRAEKTADKTKQAAPDWTGDLDGSAPIEAGAILQISRLSSTGAGQSLLSGLAGKADLDQNGTVTVGEWLRSLKSYAVTVPTLPPDLAVQSIPLSQISRP